MRPRGRLYGLRAIHTEGPRREGTGRAFAFWRDAYREEQSCD